MFVFGLLAQLLVYGALGFLSPTMSLHLMSSPGFDEFWVGIFFGVPVIIYIINTPLVSFYLKWSSRRTVIFLGMTIFCVACAMIGTSPLLGIPNSTQIIFLGLCCVGFASSMVVIPIFPEMLHSIENQLPELKGDQLNNVAAGYFNSFLGVGEAIGPIFASVMTSWIGFRKSEDIVAGIIAAYCIAFFLLCGRVALFSK